MTLNLSDYLGQTITVRFRNGETMTETVDKHSSVFYPIRFHNIFYTDDGRFCDNTTTPCDIVEVISVNSNSSNNTNTMNQTPQNIDDFIALLTAVKEQYGNIDVRCASNTGEASVEDSRYEFDDIVVVGGTKSLIRSESAQIDKPCVVFIID